MKWEVRAFLPQAESAAVVSDGTPAPMEKLHPDGFFCVSLQGAPAPYSIRAQLWRGGEVEIDDPYRYGPQISDSDLYLHTEGTLFEAYRTLGAHVTEGGVRFAVWAPNALNVLVVGEFNEWDIRRHPMRWRNGGVWELFIPGLGEGVTYKYHVRSKFGGYQQLKADPYAFLCEAPPKSASVVWKCGKYQWGDEAWMESRGSKDWLKLPMAVYEVHAGSWMRGLSYREMAVKLVEYTKLMGYTHIEFLPIMEHPFSGSWGYQVIGYFAPTARFGNPDDFKYLVDCCHRAGIGVIVDWVPAHFPKDAHGLDFFDGTALYEHADPRKGEHARLGHADLQLRAQRSAFVSDLERAVLAEGVSHRRPARGRRGVHAVSGLLAQGGRVDSQSVRRQREPGSHRFPAPLQRAGAHRCPGAFTIAEESTAFPGVSRPVYLNGLGFTMKWNMGWMHDMLDYFENDPIYRKYHHNNITFSMLYAFTENFVLPISHDEVVHGKRSLLNKMPGDEWRKFANVREFSGVHVDASREETAVHGAGDRPARGVEPQYRSFAGNCWSSIPTANCRRWRAS